MIELNIILLVLSAIILGVFLGSQITEACLFVPIWKNLNPDDFFEQHKTVGPKIYKFFAPLTILATMIPLIAVVLNLIYGSTETLLLCIMGLSTLVFFASYFLYFKEANQKFADRSLSNSELLPELVKWGNWHWGRIVFEAIAFVCSVIILLKL